MMAILFIISLGWEVVSSMPVPLYGAACVTSNDRIYILGGRNENGVQDDVIVYFPLNDSFSVLNNIITPRYNMAYCLFDDKIFLFGGKNNSGILRSVEVFDPTDSTVYSVSPMPEKLEGASAVLWKDSLIFVIGGFNGMHFSDKIYMYDPENDIWYQYPHSLLEKRAGFYTASIYDTLFIIGGINDYGPLNSSEVIIPYNPPQDFSNLINSRGYISGVSTDNSIYITGGEGFSQIFSSVEYVNLNSSSWKFFFSMNYPRMAHMSVLFNEYIYVFGGISYGNNVIDVVERIDLSTGINESDNALGKGNSRINILSKDKIKLLGKKELFNISGRKDRRLERGIYFLIDRKESRKIIVIK